MRIRSCRATVNGEQTATGHWDSASWEDGRPALIREPGDLRRSGTTASPRATGGGSLTRRGPHRRGSPRREENHMRRHIGAVGANSDRGWPHRRRIGPGRGRRHPADGTGDCRVRYLYTQVGNDGSVAASFGPGATEDTVISVADSGYDPATLKSPSTGTTTYQYLAGQASSITTAGGAAKYVLAWIAAGKPAGFDAGTRARQAQHPDRVRRVPRAQRRLPQHLDRDGQRVLAVPGRARRRGGRRRAARARNRLAHLRAAHGRRLRLRIDDSASTPPARAATPAVTPTPPRSSCRRSRQGGRRRRPTAPRSRYLHTQQESDGGFGFNAGSGSDPDSDGTVIQALVAIGQDPTGAPGR